jgi:hypothetical protein
MFAIRKTKGKGSGSNISSQSTKIGGMFLYFGALRLAYWVINESNMV